MSFEEELDRSATCPFLLRCYWRSNKHNHINDYKQIVDDIYPNNEILIYSWMDATLRELTTLVQDVVNISRHKTSEISFNLVYPNVNGILQMKSIGKVHAIKDGSDDLKTLKSLNFQVGVVVFLWDNTFDWISNKQLSYHIEVNEPSFSLPDKERSQRCKEELTEVVDELESLYNKQADLLDYIEYNSTSVSFQNEEFLALNHELDMKSTEFEQLELLVSKYSEIIETNRNLV
eukprot:gene20245-26283_t